MNETMGIGSKIVLGLRCARAQATCEATTSMLLSTHLTIC